MWPFNKPKQPVINFCEDCKYYSYLGDSPIGDSKHRCSCPSTLMSAVHKKQSLGAFFAREYVCKGEYFESKI